MFGTLPPCPHEDVGEFFEVQLGFPSHSRVFGNRLFKGFCDSFVRKNDAYLDSIRPARRKAVGQIVCVQLEKNRIARAFGHYLGCLLLNPILEHC